MSQKVRNQLTQVDLFSGIGGFLLAGRNAGFEPLFACEIEPFCRHVLIEHWPCLPILEDVHEVHAKTRAGGEWGPVTVLTGGFPFQTEYSRGAVRKNDPRSLWDQFARVAEELRPTWVLVETIPRLVHLGLDNACWDLERVGYAVAPIVLPASALDAPQRKERLFLVGALGGDTRPPDAPGELGVVEPWPAPGDRVCRVAERVSGGVDQHVSALVALGDATVPRVAQRFLEHIAAVERHVGGLDGTEAASRPERAEPEGPRGDEAGGEEDAEVETGLTPFA